MAWFVVTDIRSSPFRRIAIASPNTTMAASTASRRSARWRRRGAHARGRCGGRLQRLEPLYAIRRPHQRETQSKIRRRRAARELYPRIRRDRDEEAEDDRT